MRPTLRGSLSLLLALALTTPATPAAADEAVKQPPLAQLERAARQGGAAAQLAYGKALLQSDKTRDAAAAWIRRAAAKGLGEAWYLLGYHGLGPEEASTCFEKAASKGHAEAFGHVLDHLLFRAGSCAEVGKAKRFADLARRLSVSVGFGSDSLLSTVDRCALAGAPRIPRADLASAAEERRFDAEVGRDCTLYKTGLSVKKDLQRYGRCMLAHRAADRFVTGALACDEGDRYAFDTHATDLAELYANGWGVKRNPKLAIALVCHGSFVPAELEGMVEALHATRNQQALARPFTFCDHVTSSINTGNCDTQVAQASEKQREKAYEALASRWTDAQRAALAQLRRAGDAFFTRHAVAEQDMTGTLRVSIATEAEEALRDALLEAVRDVESGKWPGATGATGATGAKAAKAAARAERELQGVYGRLMKLEEILAGTVAKEGVRATQKLWLAYRDAWARFGAAVRPSVPEKVWRTWVTEKRTRQLKQLLVEDDPG